MSEATGQAAAAVSRKYRQAAVFYFGYGVLYLAGVLGQGRQTGWRLHGLDPIWAAIFLPLGALVAVGFAYLVWREITWFTRALAILVFARAAWLFMDISIQPLFLGPFFVAVATAWMLTRAGWDL